jgi:hypothetical protein
MNMARGKKTPPEMIYKIMASYAATNNINETARIMDMPRPTVKSIIDANKDKPEFIKLQEKKKDEFADKASQIIDKFLVLLDRKAERALGDDEQFDKLRPTEITTAIGTLYDKRALAKGENTQNESINVNIKIID